MSYDPTAEICSGGSGDEAPMLNCSTTRIGAGVPVGLVLVLLVGVSVGGILRRRRASRL